MRYRKVLALVGSFALILMFSASLLPPGAGAVTPSAGLTIDAGQLRLHMSTNGYRYSYVDAGGTTLLMQPISQRSRCTYDSTPTLVAATANAGSSVGFSTSNAQIGVDSRDGSAKCTQVNVSPESLTLDLTNGNGSTMAGLYATYAQLDVELKFSPRVTIQAFKDNGAVGDPVQYDCSTVSDCGPDRDSAGDNSYIRFPIAGTLLFDKLVITAAATGASTTSAGFSLEGGNDLYLDGTRKDSIFYMATPAEEALCPGDSISEPTGAGTATVTYLGTPDPDCLDPKAALLAYTRDATTNDRQLTFLSGGGTAATFDVFIPWDPEIATNPVFLSDTDPAGDDGNPAGEWCDGGPLSDPPAPATDFDMPAGESWCAYSLQAEPVGGANIQVTERWLLNQDANLRR
jgi:hypothetical protein